MRRLIGSGDSVAVLKEPWLIHDDDPFISSIHPVLNNAKVSSLMKIGVREWDKEVLEDVLNERDKKLVLSIPLNSATNNDGWYWCKEKSETSLHLFVHCSVAKACWSNMGIRGMDSTDATFAAWFQSGLAKWDAATKIEVSMLCWSLWKFRNDKVWNAKSPLVEEIVTSAKLTLANWINAPNRFQTTPISHSRVDNNEHWTPPSFQKLKVNVDGAIFQQEERFGAGMVARTSAGALLEARQTSFSGVVAPIMAEAVGIKEALSWIKSKGWRDVIVETDCLNVVNDINSNKPMISPYGFVIHDCKALLVDLLSVSIVFVKRSANKVAHALARNSVHTADCTFSVATLPSEISSLILDDLC
ncbi:uncharacterized protein LOC133033112 [Cannabis sativa]|uniref:uncharacterized protein LOC133033112 n=1 Tax=Cannabis sativa TaxID=3483 RepID=UPI0029CA7B4A|nr:uncharacterized protein LOC133033112 [Cannabis sativa]